MQVRVVARDYDQGRLTAAPPPAAGSATVLAAAASDLTAIERPYQLCESTTFQFKAWKGEEAECGRRDVLTSCRSASVSVVIGSETLPLTFAGCTDPAAPGRVRFEVEPREYSPSLVVQRVVNCGARNVVLSRDGTSTEAAPPGGEFPAFAGGSWQGTWSATETVWPTESCAAPRESRTGEPVPPPPPRPPELCLAVVLGCPDTDACAP